MNNENASIGERIRAIRRASGLKGADFGEKFGLGKSAVSLYEKGESHQRAPILAAIAKFGGVSLDFLITGKETQPTPPSFIDERHLPAKFQTGTTEVENNYQADRNDKDKEIFLKKAAIHFEELFDWIYEDIGQDAKSIRQGFRIIEESCADFRRWRYNFDETKKQNGTDN